jgi:hypothetical protein
MSAQKPVTENQKQVDQVAVDQLARNHLMDHAAAAAACHYPLARPGHVEEDDEDHESGQSLCSSVPFAHLPT